MVNSSGSIGVQSWCFREFKSTQALLNQIKGLGLSRIELCAVHVDFNDEPSFPHVVEQFKSAGVEISSIGVQTFKDDPGTEEKWFRFCQMAGAKMIAADIDVASMPGGLQKAQKLAEKYDIPLGIHNHGGNHWLGNVQMLRNIFKHMGRGSGSASIPPGVCKPAMIPCSGRKNFASDCTEYTSRILHSTARGNGPTWSWATVTCSCANCSK